MSLTTEETSAVGADLAPGRERVAGRTAVRGSQVVVPNVAAQAKSVGCATRAACNAVRANPSRGHVEPRQAGLAYVRGGTSSAGGLTADTVGSHQVITSNTAEAVCHIASDTSD